MRIFKASIRTVDSVTFYCSGVRFAFLALLIEFRIFMKMMIRVLILKKIRKKSTIFLISGYLLLGRTRSSSLKGILIGSETFVSEHFLNNFALPLRRSTIRNCWEGDRIRQNHTPNPYSNGKSLEANMKGGGTVTSKLTMSLEVTASPVI